jgi:hypothetical protein
MEELVGGLGQVGQPQQMVPGTPVSGLEQMRQLLMGQQEEQQRAVNNIRGLQQQRDLTVNSQLGEMRNQYSEAYPEPDTSLLSHFTSGVRGAAAFPGSKPLIGTVLGAATGLDYQNKQERMSSSNRAQALAKVAENEGNVLTKDIDSEIKNEVDILKANKLSAGLLGSGRGTMDHSGPTGTVIAGIYKKNLDIFVAARDPDAEAHAMEKTQRDLQTLYGANINIGGVQSTPIASSIPAASAIPTAGKPNLIPRDPITVAGATEAAKKEAELDVQHANDRYTVPAKVADTVLSKVQGIRDLNPTTGTIAALTEPLGNLLGSMGVENAFTNNAANLGAVNTYLVKLSNDLTTQWKGVQTEGDVIRAKAESARITDQEKLFRFNLGRMQEMAERAKGAASFAASFKNDHGQYRTKEGKHVDEVWDRVRDDAFGPTFINYGGEPVFRHEWVKAYIRANEGRGKEPEEVNNAASAAWLKVSKQKGR